MAIVPNLTIKMSGLIIAGVTLVASIVATGYGAKEDAKKYTDDRFRELRVEQRSDIKEIQKDISQLNENMATVTAIIEERLGKKHR